MKKIAIFIGLIFSAIVSIQAQQQFSQLLKTQGMLNPAYNGSREAVSGIILYRNQWVGIDGAPKTQAANLHSPLPYFDGLGIGFSFINETIGLNKDFDAYWGISYRTKVSREAVLSFGFQSGLNSYKVDINETVSEQGIDPQFNHSTSYVKPNFGAGVFLHTKKFFAGLSAPELLLHTPDSSRFKFKDITSYLYGGYVFEISPELMLKPTVLIKYQSTSPIEINANTSLLIRNMFCVGAGWRVGDALIFFADYRITNSIMIGYSYDYTLSDLNTFSKGTHEISISFDIGSLPDKKKNDMNFDLEGIKVPSIRFF